MAQSCRKTLTNFNLNDEWLDQAEIDLRVIEAAAIRELQQISGDAVKPQATDLYPADHFKTKHGIQPNTLNKARRDGRLAAEKRMGRWFYSLQNVRQLWPDAFEELNESAQK